MDRGSQHGTGGSDQKHPQEKELQKVKWLFEEDLERSGKRREAKGKGEKETYIHLTTEFQRIARRDKKIFLSEQCKEIEESNRMGKIRDLFKKSGDTKGIFHAKISKIKKKDWQLTVAQIMNSLLQNSDLN